MHSVHYTEELAYRDVIQVIIQDHLLDILPARLRYIPIVTREIWADMLSARIPQLIEDGRLEIAAD